SRGGRVRPGASAAGRVAHRPPLWWMECHTSTPAPCPGEPGAAWFARSARPVAHPRTGCHRRGMPHDTSIDPAADPAEWWEAFYREGRGRWSGRPNASVVDETRDLAPGTALDLACGQGGDAIWLAQRGWTVTAVDISASALAVAERN